MSLGSLKTLLTTLQASALLAMAPAVTVVFGEEALVAYDAALPLVVMVPAGGPWEIGYYQGADQDQDGAWSTSESCDFYIFAASTTSTAPIDQADAVESVRARLLQAMQGQQDSGLWWAPVSGQWLTGANELARYGHAYRLSILLSIAVPGVVPVDATVTTVTTTVTVTVQ